MASQEIDFTTWRKGKRTPRGRKIDLCPKCGRKGEVSTGYFSAKDGKRFVMTVTHKGKPTGIGDFTFFEVTDHCLIPLDENGQPITKRPEASK